MAKRKKKKNEPRSESSCYVCFTKDREDGLGLKCFSVKQNKTLHSEGNPINT